MFGRKYLKDSGIIVVDGKETATTRQCVHCGSHEIVRIGSGVKRGTCIMCSGFLCGDAFCMQYCVPFEARLEYQEALSIPDMTHVLKIAKRYPAIKQLVF